MFDMLTEHHLAAIAGLVGGILLGLAARLGRFCTLGAIEDVLYGGSTLRMRMWILAIGVAVIGSFSLIASGLMDESESFYLSIRWMPLASIIGGLMFGYGMALSGNCGYGAIARLGGGDLRSFVIVLVMGVSTYVVLSGPLAPLRNFFFEQHQVTTDIPPGLAHHAAALTGLPLHTIGLAVGAVLVIAALCGRELRQDKSAVFWSVIVGLAIVSGWGLTSEVNQTGFEALPVVSHSFSAPLGETILWTMTGSLRPLSFAVGSIAGVWAGAFIGSLIKGHFRWEACEDPRELRRQIVGAGIMGAGAVIAMGCTVGQGLSAFSLLAVSAPVTFLAIFAGAAIGLRQLIEGFRPAE
ncbi:MAG: YeeE/YedE family protein [Pseudophaeobacter sp. bin_em_oilr2.035]|uniref:YeeE/YedE family protein n=1 Tax=Phaeobacter gallaeciensis TaxID=60890 RepID=A0ABD4X789_9RHOB|nr:YeeE/YedE family protein [Phaeobacter gallaeciensis]MDF1771130.1 YeeE/YedE family protein [Pseudophaeobacter sp. bin_em_oilr2.035]MDE4143940.1 YeeE/YedE family protein [Phaeobacter gallaeciensis]MDE4155698.1 YeeE/YedE family protein [Phaeobacter gallaeciensis]MDE4159886.1 YeeE/YedE family protein [Phaeobacter gallaeciensis]MDE4165020.1 YeeE/YedE family protein [Phaeobacter gallaeciensis]